MSWKSAAFLSFLLAGIAVAQSSGTLKWQIDIGQAVFSTPAIANDGTIYFGCTDNNLYAINPVGSKKWIVNAGWNVATSPAIGGDGTIYIGSNLKTFYAFNPGGSQKWTFPISDNGSTSASVGIDGTIYFASGREFIALKPDGTKKWSFMASDYIHGDLAIGGDGTIYFGSLDDMLYALAPDGTKKWSLFLGDLYALSPAIGPENIIYVESLEKYIYAILPDGTIKWRQAVDDYLQPAAVGSDGTIYWGTEGGNLLALDPDGKTKWIFSARGRISVTPAIGNDGAIYFCTDLNVIYALNPDGTQQWSYQFSQSLRSSPTIMNNRTLLVGYGIGPNGYGGGLLAIHCSSDGLAQSTWPKSNGNIQNTGMQNAQLIIADKSVSFSFTKTNEIRQHEIMFYNSYPEPVKIIACKLNHQLFSVKTPLPATIGSRSYGTLIIEFKTSKSGIYSTSAEIEWERNGQISNKSIILSELLFLNDGSERALTARRALTIYDSCRAIDPNSAATLNNLGLLYRFLGEYDIAAEYLQKAVSKALTDQDSYAGIKMNQGVVLADQKNPVQAKEAWHAASVDLAEISPLTPQIDYNLAHEAYTQDSLEVALAAVNRTLAAIAVNNFLRAKAHVLRGAIRFRLAAIDSSRADFTRAQSLDPDGPIGQMARENLDALATGVTTPVALEPQAYALLPNFPNPFNPETRLRFALPQPGEVVVEICNLAGQRVRRLLSAAMPAGWHETVWNGCDDLGALASSGIYLCQVRSGRWQAVQKITLLH